MICPILYPIGDQKFWGQHAYKKGLAVKPIPIKKMTEKKFLASVQELLTRQQLYENAKQMQVFMNNENGCQKTIEEIEQHFALSQSRKMF